MPSPLAYSVTIQNQVANALFGTVYSALTDAQKLAFDGNSASSPPTAGVAVQVWTQLTQYSQWWYKAGATVNPDVWSPWLAYAMTRRLAIQYKPERVAEFRDLELEAMRSALDTFTAEDPNSTPIDPNSTSTTFKSIRFFVMEAAQGRTPPVFLSPTEIDQATIQIARDVWNRTQWNFRRRTVSMTIALDQTVTFSGLGSGEAFWAWASTALFYTDNPLGNGLTLTYVNPEDFERALAINAGIQNGRPSYFRVSRSGTGAATLTWRFAPAPDGVYTVRGEAVIAGPANPTDADSATPFSLFPDVFVPILKDYVLGTCLAKRGGEVGADGRKLRSDCNDLIERMFSDYTTSGLTENRTAQSQIIEPTVEAACNWDGGYYSGMGGGGLM